MHLSTSSFKSNIMSKETFYSAIKPYVVISKYIGLIGFKFAEKGFKVSKINAFINILMTFIYTFFTLYVMYKKAFLNNCSPSLSNTTDYIKSSVSLVFIATTWITSGVQQKLRINLFLQMIHIDKEIIRNGIPVSYKRFGKKVFHCAVLGTVLVISNVVLQTYPYRSDFFLKDLLFNIIYYLPVTLHTAFCQHVTLFTMVAQKRLEMLNNRLRDLKKLNADGYKRANTTKYTLKSLRNVCYIHHLISKMIKTTNEAFGLVLLVSFIVSFVAIVTGLHILGKAFQTMENDWLQYFVPFISCLNYIVSTILMCTTCQATINEFNKSGILIHKIDTDDNDVKDQIEMFSLQIANEQAEYNAAGFFPVDHTLLFSIIAGVTTYLIILIQLSKD